MAAEGGPDAANGGSQLGFADSLDGIGLQVCYIHHQLHFAILTAAQRLDHKILSAPQQSCSVGKLCKAFANVH